jgi:hypothetical protein
MKYQEAIKTVQAALRRDKELYYSFQANIAMQFVDENRRQGSRDSYKKVHGVANEAAKNFINLLIKPVRPQKNGSGSHYTQQSKAGSEDYAQIAARMRELASEPCKAGFVPISTETLNEWAQQLLPC